jgi:hypothetical protein
MPTRYFVASPGLLQIAVRLEAAGVQLVTAHLAYEILRKQIARAADDLVDYFVKQVEESDGPDDVMKSVGGLRAVGTEAVQLVFAQEIERALGEAMDQGRVLPPPRRKRR